MCCRTNGYCCSPDMRNGIILAAIIDAIICLAVIIFNAVLVGFFLSLWLVVVFIADILLMDGATNANPRLLMVWLVIGMVNIVLLFVSWIGWPVYAVFYIFVSSDVCTQHANGFCMSDAERTAWFWGNLVYIIGSPIYYIYLWIVVKSHRENLVESETDIQPMHEHQQGAVNLYYMNCHLQLLLHLIVPLLIISKTFLSLQVSHEGKIDTDQKQILET